MDFVGGRGRAGAGGFKVGEHVAGAHLGVVTSDADQAFAGLAGPANNVAAGNRRTGLRITKLVDGRGIRGIGLGGVSLRAHGQADAGIVDVADGEDHGIDVEFGGLIGGLGGGAVTLGDEQVFVDNEALDAAVGTGLDFLGRAEEAEGHARPGGRRLGGLVEHRKNLVRLGDVLTDGGDATGHAIHFVLEGVAVEVHLDVLHFLLVELGLEGTPTGDDDDFLGGVVGIVEKEPARDVDHDVAHADDGDALAGGEILAGEGRELVVEIDEILGGIDAPGVLARETELLGSLRADGVNGSGWVEGAKVTEVERIVVANGDVAKVVNVGKSQDLRELLAEADLHLVLGGIDSVLGEAAGLDVAIEDDDGVAGLCNFLGGKHTGGSGADDEYGFHKKATPILTVTGARRRAQNIQGTYPGLTPGAAYPLARCKGASLPTKL